MTILGRHRSLADWPNAKEYVPAAVDSIALLIFGPDVFEGEDILPNEYRKPVMAFAQRSWNRIRDKIQRDRGKISDLEKNALTAFEGMFPPQTYL